MISVKRYEAAFAPRWDAFVDGAKNGMFMFRRGYMDYHADRFADYSLCIFRDEDLIAVMPACAKEKEFSSHAGLTFGGILSDARMRTPLMLEVVEAVRGYLRAQEFATCIYKAIPYIYHRHPAQEDSYALLRAGEARVVRCDVTATIIRANPLPYSDRRTRGIKKARKADLTYARSQDYERYFALVGDLLKGKYDSRPTHTAAEMQLLAERFPDNIHLWTAARGEEMLAGVILYISAQVAHAQYIAASDEGKECGALDALFDRLIAQEYVGKPCFDFGISTEQAGRHLNAGLITQKEEFGARAVVHETFEWTL